MYYDIIDIYRDARKCECGGRPSVTMDGMRPIVRIRCERCGFAVQVDGTLSNKCVDDALKYAVKRWNYRR